MSFQAHPQRYSLGTLDVEERILGYAEGNAAPQSVEQEVLARGPDSHGFAGNYRRVGLRDGFSVSTGDLVAPNAFQGIGSAEPGLSVTVMLEGEGEGWLSGQNRASLSQPVGYGPGLVFLYFARIATRGIYEVPAGSRFRTVELRLDLPFLKRSGRLELFDRAGREHPLCQISSELIWIGRTAATRGMRIAAQALLDGDALTSVDSTVEARALDILSEIGPLMEGQPRTHVRRPALRASERAALDAVRALMLGDLAHAWSLSDLAARVGLSPTKLKIGFRECFGLPVYAFLQRSRLEEAMELIRRYPDLSVTDVSLAVGYANPSHFAHLFQREFGKRPSEARLSRRP